ncbi:hypothetical protein DBR32_01750 [Taibaiella sp. KBW10]|uniref:hypothetical protein n=1 Tax=Taibaiella sp. KBW10 TaxID=2153357 RepID=UPI000F5A1082|nr:hypothetical protein [Taibaiella sp. KBW10]RQO32355.1 hypothetical protein DBR32_01750 [Taibaiella sp. KBW10]
MIFNTTSRIKSKLSPEIIKSKLLGQRVLVHQLDFEVLESNGMLKVIPHAENIDGLKTLPITHIEMEPNAAETTIKISSKPRKIDVGGLYLIIAFVVFMFMVALYFWKAYPDETFIIPLALLAVGLIIFIVFMLRMQSGYYDYIRKIRHFLTAQVK